MSAKGKATLADRDDMLRAGYMTAYSASRVLGKTPETVRRWVKAERLVGETRAGILYVTTQSVRSAILKWLEDPQDLRYTRENVNQRMRLETGTDLFPNVRVPVEKA